jgi:hypothetical protein
MSYDLFFWREESKAKLDPTEVLKSLRDTVSLNGVLAVPFAEVKQAFKNEFPDICDSGGALEWDSDGSGFDVSFVFLDERTVSLVTTCCTYDLLKSPGALERIHSVARSLNCRVYDPHQPPSLREQLGSIVRRLSPF